MNMNYRINGLSIVALCLMIVMGFNIVLDGLTSENVTLDDLVARTQPRPDASLGNPVPQPSLAPDPDLFTAPYTRYVVTQGVHGASYGHQAIDIAAGKGTTILSPINGVVAARHTDEYGNPTLILENERFRVTLLHGDYFAAVGDVVAAGDPIGYESNKGYTTDMAGNSCRNRECGYHTHLNVFDKELDANINPLALLQSD